jgi:hypothetical protein
MTISDRATTGKELFTESGLTPISKIALSFCRKVSRPRKIRSDPVVGNRGLLRDGNIRVTGWEKQQFSPQ